MKKAPLLLVTLLLTAGTGFAQLNDFNLSDYKLPQLERRTLETNFNLNGNNIHRKFIESADQLSDVNSLNSNASIAYRYFLNSEQWQRDNYTSLSLGYSYDNRKLWDDLFLKNSGLSLGITTDQINRYYFDTRRFAELNLFAYYNPQFSSNYSKDYNYNFGYIENDYKSRLHFVKIIPSIKAGVGRIEPVQDARHAVYILEELVRVARMSPDKSSEEVLAFAQLISELKNERFFDARIKRIFELEQLDSFLLANNYVLDYDATYFATLADKWAFGGTPERYSGQRISAAFIPSFDYRNFYNISKLPTLVENRFTFRTLGLYGGVEYVREKPINLTWQNTIDAAGYFGWVQISRQWGDSENSYTSRIPHFQIGATQTIGYYPSTRTNASLGYGLQYVKFFDASNEANNIDGVNGQGIRAGIGFNMNYYFSPQLRFNANWSLDYLWQDSGDYMNIDFFFRPGQGRVSPDTYFSNPYSYLKSQLDHRFSAGLIYSIF